MAPGGFRFDVSERGAQALVDSGWVVASAFDADCTQCHGEGPDADGNECPCGGLLWVAPTERRFPSERSPPRAGVSAPTHAGWLVVAFMLGACAGAGATAFFFFARAVPFP